MEMLSWLRCRENETHAEKDIKERMKTEFIWMLAWLLFVAVAYFSQWSSFVSSFYTKKHFSLFFLQFLIRFHER